MKCKKCRDSGVKFIMCCSGDACACFGQPVQSTNCDCLQPKNLRNLNKDEKVIYHNVEWIGGAA